jgi:hypothetical protein
MVRVRGGGAWLASPRPAFARGDAMGAQARMTALAERVKREAAREPLALPVLPPTLLAVPGVDRVSRSWEGALGRVEVEYVPGLETLDGEAMAGYMAGALTGEHLREPELLAAALADALQRALGAVTLIVRVWYRDSVRADAVRGLGL